MTTYPIGAKLNLTVANIGQPQYQPIAESNWRMFAPSKDAEAGLKMIKTVVPDATMKKESEGQYAQIHYDSPHPDICVRSASGSVGGLKVQEYPSDIFDRSKVPQPFIDKYNAGQTPVLKISQIAEGLGQLYWDSSDRV